MCCRTVETVRPYIRTQQNGNFNDYIEMYEIFIPKSRDWNRPIPGFRKFTKMPGIRDPGIGIPTWNVVG
jgi:hypothetical protein